MHLIRALALFRKKRPAACAQAVVTSTTELSRGDTKRDAKRRSIALPSSVSHRSASSNECIGMPSVAGYREHPRMKTCKQETDEIEEGGEENRVSPKQMLQRRSEFLVVDIQRHDAPPWSNDQIMKHIQCWARSHQVSAGVRISQSDARAV